MNKALIQLCNLHNTISPESIHLALRDMEDSLVADPEMTLLEFLDRVVLLGIQHDDKRFKNATRHATKSSV